MARLLGLVTPAALLPMDWDPLPLDFGLYDRAIQLLLLLNHERVVRVVVPAPLPLPAARGRVSLSHLLPMPLLKSLWLSWFPVFLGCR
jgi:hypothetical protein